MSFRKIPVADPVYKSNYTKFKSLVDEYETFVYLTSPKRSKQKSGKSASYAKYLVRAIIITSEVFNIEFGKNDYTIIQKYLDKLRNHPGYKEYNEDEGRFPNASIKAFSKFVNDNQFISHDTVKEKEYPFFIEEELYSEVIEEGIKEGAKTTYYVSKYERNPKLRLEAIRIHGLNCSVCDINMEEVYGELGRGYIEVHHIFPLYSLKEETTVNPETDLLPLCPNCHRIIHRKRDKILTVEELRDIIK